MLEWFVGRVSADRDGAMATLVDADDLAVVTIENPCADGDAVSRACGALEQRIQVLWEPLPVGIPPAGSGLFMYRPQAEPPQRRRLGAPHNNPVPEEPHRVALCAKSGA